MKETTKFDVLMAAIQQLQSQLEGIDERLKRIERTTGEPPEQRKTRNLIRRDEPLAEEPRRRPFTED